MTGLKVPFSSDAFTKDEKEAVLAVLDSNWASNGPICAEFQSELEKYLGSHVALVNTGSAALMVALLANGVKAGDTVLVPDFTFIATASVPAILGCRIVPVDADPETFNMKQMSLGSLPFGKVITTAVAGLPPSWEQVGGITDAAEALGAEVRGEKLGGTKLDDNWLTTFSFQTTKQLSTVEGGAIASRDEELIARCRCIADYGRTETRYLHAELGMNFRMTDWAAAIGLIRLRRLDETLRRREEIAKRYRQEITEVEFQKTPNYVTRHAWWTATMLTENEYARDGYLKDFQKAGIDARKSWLPIHLQPCFEGNSFTEYPENYPNAELIYKRAVLLPIFNTMSDDQVDRVIEVANS